jgi:hypothetical protein
MTEGYLAHNKKTPQGVTNVEVILSNYLIKDEKSKQSNGKSKHSYGKDFNFPLNGKLKDLQLKDFCHAPCGKPLARNDRFCFQNSNRIWELGSNFSKTFV